MAKKEKQEAVLTEAEKKRLAQFEAMSEELVGKGYRRKDLTIGMGKANLFSILLFIPLFIVGYGAYYLVHGELGFSKFNFFGILIAFLVLIVIHELIHGISWSFFTPHHFKDVEFGVMRSSLTPYCTCKVPLKKGQYAFGSVMPLVLLGILPMIVGVAIGNPTVLFIGILMADTAGGDLMILHQLLSYKSDAREVIYADHPTEAGLVVFERD